jgi:Tfp pilus assembly protein PilF
MNKVEIWQEAVIIPTYSVGIPDKNPMFFEKRVYQGSNGSVYPLPVTEKLFDEKEDKSYCGLFVENQYLKIMILPELGGRLQMAYDKINRRHLFYYNNVIKPALIGLAGPWISGGIEFNYPEHHRPSSFDPVDYFLEENNDGSKTIWVSEIERLQRTKCMNGFTLYPDKAYLEIKVRIYNRSSIPQTFLWWANAAMHGDDDFQTIFPPDVSVVWDHGKRDVSKYPIATGKYYKWDYGEGVDISWFKNVISPSSFMVDKTDYDFLGGYDHHAGAGMMHIANHHISPGKKLFTWGQCEFSYGWYNQLTDEDGPYLELMAGVYSENQPDFAWLQPYEEKSFSQYFMPYKDLKSVKNASVDVMVNLEVKNRQVLLQVYCTSEQTGLRVQLTGEEGLYIYEKLNLSPSNSYNVTVELKKEENEYNLQARVSDQDGREMISCKPLKPKIFQTPDPAKPVILPEEIRSNEQLYLTGLHLEQYRHATFDPLPYYLEVLKRDKTDVRCNNAYGLWLFKHGCFAESERYFTAAIASLTVNNRNPYDGEPFYNLGLAFKAQDKLDEAYKNFFKSGWNSAWKDPAYFAIAQIDCLRGDYRLALEHIEISLSKNVHSHKARHLKAAILRKLEKKEELLQLIRESIQLDRFNFGMYFEKYLVEYPNNPESAKKSIEEMVLLLRNNSQNYLEFAIDYSQSGLFVEAIKLLEVYERINSNNQVLPLLFYFKGLYYFRLENSDKAVEMFKHAEQQRSDYCFPHQMEAIEALQIAIEMNPSGAKAHYYLGNLLYDKCQYDKAIKLWEQSVNLDNTFPTSYRNLSIAYYNKKDDPKSALAFLLNAFELDQTDHRIFYELDQLYKKINYNPHERLALHDKYPQHVHFRDDLYLERIILCNSLGKFSEAKQMIAYRKFHPWEASEGRVCAQYQLCYTQLAREAIDIGHLAEAIELLNAAFIIPANIGEGKLPETQENDIHYYMGCAYEALGEKMMARDSFNKATIGLEELSLSLFYTDQPADKLYYQGLAYEKLDNVAKAKALYNKLITWSENHISDEIKIDFFALQIADTLIFKDNMKLKNQAHCKYLMALGKLGFKDYGAAQQLFNEVLEIDQNHQGAIIHKLLCR